MIIRSQDKKSITTDLNLTIYEDEWTHKWEITNNLSMELGIYSTEEKAIKVLDMIQKFYAAIELTKTGRNIANSEVREFEDMVFGCFEMPSDEEVEV